MNIAIISPINHFWNAFPALFYGLSFLLGFYFRFDWMNSLFPLFLLWISSVLAWQIYYKRLILSALLILSAYFYGISSYQFPSLPEEGIEGKAHLVVQSLSAKKTFFGKRWVYHCRLKQFVPANAPLSESLQGLNCSIFLSQKDRLRRPPANQDYVLQGVLIQTAPHHYILKVEKDSHWLPVEGSWSSAEWRYLAKQSMANWIQQKFSNERAAKFLAGLLTGDFDDRFMQHEFNRFGLQHIMAISGFHFSILAALIGFLLRLWLPRKAATLCIITLLTGYFVFLGCNSSIIRAWTMISIAMLGSWLGMQARALNSLGIALFVVLLIDPLLSLTAGFQFSFLATAAILIGYSSMDALLCKVLTKRPLSQMVEMDAWNQLGYCILSWFRQGTALAIVINGLTWPLILYHFHQFSFMSLLYNLFFPFLVSLSICLLLIGLLAGLLFPWLGQAIHSFNDFYTKWSLNLIYNMPYSIDSYYQMDNFPKELLVIYICCMLMGGMLFHLHMKQHLTEY